MVEPGQVWKVKLFVAVLPEYLLILGRTWENTFDVLTNESHFDLYSATTIEDCYEKIL